MRVQEAAVWSSPLVSCVWVVVTQVIRAVNRTSRNFKVPGEGPCTVYGVKIEKKDRSVSTSINAEKAHGRCSASKLRRKIEVFPQASINVEKKVRSVSTSINIEKKVRSVSTSSDVPDHLCTRAFSLLKAKIITDGLFG